MNKLAEAIKLIEEDYRYKFIEYDDDGDDYDTAGKKERSRYQKVIDTLRYLNGEQS